MELRGEPGAGVRLQTAGDRRRDRTTQQQTTAELSAKFYVELAARGKANVVHLYSDIWTLQFDRLVTRLGSLTTASE